MDNNSTNNSESDKPESDKQSVAEAQPEVEVPPNQWPLPANPEPVAGPSGLQNQNVPKKVRLSIILV